MIIKAILSAAISLGMISSALASGTVVSAVGATVLSGGPGYGSIDDTWNSFGLLTDYDYTGGTTDWDAYFAAKPYHDFDAAISANGGQEWFSNDGATSVSVSYDLGKVQSIQGLALWNEEDLGIRRLNLLGSVDGTTWFNLLSNLSPTNNPSFAPYLADLYTWTAKSLRYVRLDMSGCPQSGAPSGLIVSCGVGEVAFNAAPTPSVPELSVLNMSIMGLGAMAFGLRRRRQL